MFRSASGLAASSASITARPIPLASPPSAPPTGALPLARQQLRLRSIGWALLAGSGAGAIGLLQNPGPQGLEAALRAAGCGFFYGLLAFHLQRVDPDDSHLQAGLVGAVCAFRSLAGPLDRGPTPLEVMMVAVSGWLPLWLPLIGSALLLHAAQRHLSVLRP